MKTALTFTGIFVLCLGAIFIFGCLLLGAMAGYDSAMSLAEDIAKYGEYTMLAGAACLGVAHFLK